MRNTLTIHKSRETMPMSLQSNGVIDLGTRKDHHYVYNEDVCQQVSGIPFIRIDTDVILSRKEILFLLSRVRGDETITPSGGAICIWRCSWGNKTVLAIGGEQIDLLHNENRISNEELEEWIDQMLKEQF